MSIAKKNVLKEKNKFRKVKKALFLHFEALCAEIERKRAGGWGKSPGVAGAASEHPLEGVA